MLDAALSSALAPAERIRESIVMSLTTAAYAGAPDAHGSSALEHAQVPQVAYVDDTGFMLGGSAPRLLRKSIETALCHVVREFSLAGLQLNWKSGKSECLLRVRSRDTMIAHGEHRVDDGLFIRVLAEGEDTPQPKLYAVENVHLGSAILVNGSLHEDAKAPDRRRTNSLRPDGHEFVMSKAILETCKVDATQR